MSEFSHLVGDFEGFVQGYGVLAVTVILTLEAIGFPGAGREPPHLLRADGEPA